MAIEEPLKIERRPSSQSDLYSKAESQWGFFPLGGFSQVFCLSVWGLLRHSPFCACKFTHLWTCLPCISPPSTLPISRFPASSIGFLAASCLTARPILDPVMAAPHLKVLISVLLRVMLARLVKTVTELENSELKKDIRDHVVYPTPLDLKNREPRQETAEACPEPHRDPEATEWAVWQSLGDFCPLAHRSVSHTGSLMNISNWIGGNV